MHSSAAQTGLLADSLASSHAHASSSTGAMAIRLASSHMGTPQRRRAAMRFERPAHAAQHCIACDPAAPPAVTVLVASHTVCLAVQQHSWPTAAACRASTGPK